MRADLTLYEPDGTTAVPGGEFTGSLAVIGSLRAVEWTDNPDVQPTHMLAAPARVGALLTPRRMLTDGRRRWQVLGEEGAPPGAGGGTVRRRLHQEAR